MMGELLQQSVGIASSLLLLFGGLAFWPLIRFGAGRAGGATELLKWQFYVQIMLLAASFLAVQYFSALSVNAGINARILPYSVGAFSWIAALIILFGTGLLRRFSDEPVDDEHQ